MGLTQPLDEQLRKFDCLRAMQTLLSYLIVSSLVCWAFFTCAAFAAADESVQQPILAPGYGNLAFEAPLVGSYKLPPIYTAADGVVLDEQGNVLHLHDLFGDRYVLLSFMYSSCSDVNGCPLATAVYHRINTRLKKEPELADKLRLISLSFDPQHDTPEVMRLYGSAFSDGDVEWRFLTTESEKQLDPILEAYNQSILRDYDEQGNYLGTISHILRVFLIDPQLQIRNIYSVSFLHPDILINDLKTLLQE